MKFKLDENFGVRTLPLFAARGHEVETVAGERLCGAPDDELFEVCKREKRCPVTLDRDFADVLRFPRVDLRDSLFFECPGTRPLLT